MVEGDPLGADKLDSLLGTIIRDNRDKVIGWMREEPGCWGFLAGKAVAAWRQQAGRPLDDQERRLVWDRLWWWLERLKAEVLG